MNSQQEKYIAGQKNCGIEVGDTVMVLREADGHAGGWTQTWVPNLMEVGMIGTAQGIKDSDGIQIKKDGCRYPYFVLEIVKKANGTVPDAKPIDKGDSNMKTQEIYNVVVTENEKVKDDNGQIESIKKNVIYAKNAISAYTPENALIKAVVAAVKANEGTFDVDELEVKVRPFCG